MPKQRKIPMRAIQKRRKPCIDDLPPELLSQILSPTVQHTFKNIRTRGVCKQWKLIVDSVLWCQKCKHFKSYECDSCHNYGCSCNTKLCDHKRPNYNLGSDIKCSSKICDTCLPSSDWELCNRCSGAYSCGRIEHRTKCESCAIGLCADCIDYCQFCSQSMCDDFDSCAGSLKCRGCHDVHAGMCSECMQDTAVQNSILFDCCICKNEMCSSCAAICSVCDSLICRNSDCIYECNCCEIYLCKACDEEHLCKGKKTLRNQ